MSAGDDVSKVALSVQDRHSQHSALETAFNATDVIVPVGYEGRINGASSMLVVVGHRGCGQNRTYPHGVVPESRPSVRENTITSFNMAARNGAHFVEFDVQVTKDGVPIIFHDDEITLEGNISRHISDLTLTEFRAIGPQRDFTMGQVLYSKASDGSTYVWTADVEDCLCTLKEAFMQVEATVGFNIELKFDDYGITADAELHRVIDAVLDDVRQYANGRVIYFSSFHPDAVQIVRKNTLYPVFFLTDGGTFTYQDPRKNTIEAAIEICRVGNLHGIVCEVKAVLQRPASVALVRAAGLYFFTYGELNNLGEAVLKQRDWGIDGVIVDHVLEMVRVARQSDDLASPSDAAVARRGVAVV